MNYDQENLLQDYAQRTLENLRTIEKLNEDDPALSVYETTQLINSLLGLIILPVEEFFEQLPAIPKDVLVRLGWKIPQVVGEFPQVNDLCELMWNLRNAAAHFNIRFLTDDGNQISGLEIWNQDPRSKDIVWQAIIGIIELRDLLERFVSLVFDPQYSKYRRCAKIRSKKQ